MRFIWEINFGNCLMVAAVLVVLVRFHLDNTKRWQQVIARMQRIDHALSDGLHWISGG